MNYVKHKIKDIKDCNLTKTSFCLKELRFIKLIYLEKLIEFIKYYIHVISNVFTIHMYHCILYN